MKVYHELSHIPFIPNAVVTQGTYDGVHLGHQIILNQLKQLARDIEGETVVITFHPHPRMVLYPDDHGLKLLHTLSEKTEALRDLGIDHLVVIPFTREFSRYDSAQFIQHILVNQLHTQKLVIGYNHRFGRNREGTFEHLQVFAPTYGFEVVEIPKQAIDNEAVSSTRIRHALEKGQIKEANTNLGYNYAISGTVIYGKQLGRTIGFPTANIKVNDAHKLIPADGVYAIRVFINNRWHQGMLNIGYRPTVDGLSHSIEAHIFEFNDSIYGAELTIRFVDKLRDEIKFANIDELKSQLQNDTLHALHVLKETR